MPGGPFHLCLQMKQLPDVVRKAGLLVFSPLWYAPVWQGKDWFFRMICQMGRRGARLLEMRAPFGLLHGTFASPAGGEFLGGPHLNHL